MAEIVLGVGSSHGPTIQSRPERWPELGAKDVEDPRYSFEDALKAAPADIEEQLAPERMQARYEAIQRAIARLSDVMAEAAADVIVVISNPHGVPPADRMEPVFGIYMSESDSTIERSGPRVTPLMTRSKRLAAKSSRSDGHLKRTQVISKP